jgi:hypothetical protein
MLCFRIGSMFSVTCGSRTDVLLMKKINKNRCRVGYFFRFAVLRDK